MDIKLHAMCAFVHEIVHGIDGSPKILYFKSFAQLFDSRLLHVQKNGGNAILSLKVVVNPPFFMPSFISHINIKLATII